jgi:hypothetical protein
MLDIAFYETSDYQTLAEFNNRCIVVGRRGTGKSALVYRLEKFWQSEQRTAVYTIAPVDAQILGIRQMLGAFGDNYIHLQTGAKMAWKYAMILKIFSQLASHYKLKTFLDHEGLTETTKDWESHMKIL